MNERSFIDLLEAWHKTKVDLAINKGHDYANNGDMLANFKRMHKTCSLYEIQPGKRIEDVFLFYFLIKLDRMVNLLHSDKEPSNESVDDTMQDIGLYIELLRAYLEER